MEMTYRGDDSTPDRGDELILQMENGTVGSLLTSAILLTYESNDCAILPYVSSDYFKHAKRRSTGCILAC